MKRAEFVSCRCQQSVIGSVELQPNNVFHVSNSDIPMAAQVFGERVVTLMLTRDAQVCIASAILLLKSLIPAFLLQAHRSDITSRCVTYCVDTHTTSSGADSDVSRQCLTDCAIQKS